MDLGRPAAASLLGLLGCLLAARAARPEAIQLAAALREEPNGTMAFGSQALSSGGSSEAAFNAGGCCRGSIPGSALQGWHEVDALRAEIQCLVATGQWVHRGHARPLPWPRDELDLCDSRWVREGKGHVAGARADKVQLAKDWKVRDTLKWQWEVGAQCSQSWVPFNKTAFCSILHKLGGPIMFVGDSITRLTFKSLVNYVGGSVTDRVNLLGVPRLCKHWEKTGVLAAAGDATRVCMAVEVCASTVYFVRNDHLSTLEGEPDLNRQNNVFAMPWMSLLKTWGVKAVVLNRGAHVVPTNMFEEELDASLRVLRSRHPDLLVLYRSAAPGHKDCMNHRYSPLEVHQNESSLPYGWDLLHEQNLIAKRTVEAYGGVYVDIEPLAALRADGHFGMVGRNVDCLHYCSPGPVDSWTQLLYNAFLHLVPV